MGVIVETLRGLHGPAVVALAAMFGAVVVGAVLGVVTLVEFVVARSRRRAGPVDPRFAAQIRRSIRRGGL